MKYTITFLLCLFATNAISQNVWKTYHHKNGYTIQLPDYFTVSKPTEHGTLQLYGNNKNARMYFAIETKGKCTPQELQASFDNQSMIYMSVSYKLLKPTWYIVIGQMGAEMFYDKSIIKNGIVHNLRIHYPATDKPLLDSLSAKIGGSFK